MILSMPANTDPQRLKEAALAFARNEFANRCWVAALHVDRDHPHVHLTVARRDHDGRRFHPDRDDLFRYRQRFAQKLRDCGIEANATPARARGIDPRHEPIAARKIREQGAVPQIDKSRADRVRRLRETGRSDPVEVVLEKRQTIFHDTFQRSIDELLMSRSLVYHVTAQTLRNFVAAIPKPVRAIQIGRERDALVPAAPERGESSAATDPVAAALARMEAAKAKIEIRRARGGEVGDPVVAALARLEAAKTQIEMRRAGSGDATDPPARILDRSMRRWRAGRNASRMSIRELGRRDGVTTWGRLGCPVAIGQRIVLPSIDRN
jgi:DNA-directed RNA polymerase subunit K/omega